MDFLKGLKFVGSIVSACIGIYFVYAVGVEEGRKLERKHNKQN